MSLQFSFLFPLAVGLAVGETYYVADTGSDEADGTSPATAWRTIARASSQSYRSHDTLLLSRGSTWLDSQLRIDAYGAVGFVLGSYGNSSLPRPMIELARPSKASYETSCIIIKIPVSEITVKDLHVAGCARGLTLVQSSGTNSSGLLIQDNFFRDIRSSYEGYTPSAGRWGRSIAFRSDPSKSIEQLASGRTEAHGVVIRRNLALRASVFFEGGNSEVFLRDPLLQANTVENCGGNCYSIDGVTGLTLEDSVFLRDRPDRYFVYGSTDVIVWSVHGTNVIRNNDFYRRGETAGGPDGCAIDLEVAPTGLQVYGNTLSQSWGAGVMIYGHADTARDFNISSNVFDRAGCGSIGNDHGGISIICPRGDLPTGTVTGNTFQTCPSGGVPAIWTNPSVPGCNASVNISGNRIDTTRVVAPPRFELQPTPSQFLQFSAISDTPNATIRYTIDGSRPTEESPRLGPGEHVRLPWPSQAVAVNVRAFREGFAPSVTNGKIVELRGIFPLPQVNMRGNVDGLLVKPMRMLVKSSTGEVSAAIAGGLRDSESSQRDLIGRAQIKNTTTGCLSGWVVDPFLPGGGVPPVNVSISIDGSSEPVAEVVADVYREDLVKAGVAPNPQHGFSYCFAGEQWQQLAKGLHRIAVQARGSPQSSVFAWTLPSSPVCVLEGRAVLC